MTAEEAESWDAKYDTGGLYGLVEFTPEYYAARFWNGFGRRIGWSSATYNNPLLPLVRWLRTAQPFYWLMAQSLGHYQPQTYWIPNEYRSQTWWSDTGHLVPLYLCSGDRRFLDYVYGATLSRMTEARLRIWMGDRENSRYLEAARSAMWAQCRAFPSKIAGVNLAPQPEYETPEELWVVQYKIRRAQWPDGRGGAAGVLWGTLNQNFNAKDEHFHDIGTSGHQLWMGGLATGEMADLADRWLMFARAEVLAEHGTSGAELRAGIRPLLEAYYDRIINGTTGAFHPTGETYRSWQGPKPWLGPEDPGPGPLSEGGKKTSWMFSNMTYYTLGNFAPVWTFENGAWTKHDKPQPGGYSQLASLPTPALAPPVALFHSRALAYLAATEKDPAKYAQWVHVAYMIYVNGRLSSRTSPHVDTDSHGAPWLGDFKQAMDICQANFRLLPVLKRHPRPRYRHP